MEWIKKEPVACAIGLLVIVIGGREYFRDPAAPQQAVPKQLQPQRVIIETTGGQAITDPDGTVRVKIETEKPSPEKRPAEDLAETLATAKADAQKLANAEPPVVEVPEKEAGLSVPMPVEASETESSNTAGSPETSESSNTAGGIGEAPIKAKSKVESVVPKEAIKLADGFRSVIPALYQRLRQSGRLNWQLGDLNDDVLVLTLSEEKYLTDVIAALENYLRAVANRVNTAEANMDVENDAAIVLRIYVDINDGQIVHNQFREELDRFYRIENPSGPNSFYDVENIGGPKHMLNDMKIRLVTRNLRRSDLFYLIAAFRLANDDYSQWLKAEGDHDRFHAMLDQVNVGFQVFLAEDGESKAEIERKQLKRFSDALRRVGLAGNEDYFNALRRQAAERLERSNQLNDRDTLKTDRTEMESLIARVEELLGKEWSMFDFAASAPDGRDFYLFQRLLLEEQQEAAHRGTFSEFRRYMERLTSQKKLDDMARIALEVLEPAEAEHLASYLVSSEPELYNKPYAGSEGSFDPSELTHSLRLVFSKMGSLALRRMFSELPDPKLEKSVWLFLDGLKNDGDDGIKKMKESFALFPAGRARRDLAMAHCKKNGLEDALADILAQGEDHLPILEVKAVLDRAAAFNMEQKSGEALKLMRKFKPSQIGSENLLGMFAWQFAMAGAAAEAKPFAERAVEITNRRNAACLSTLSMIYSELEDFETSEKLLEESNSQNPDTEELKSVNKQIRVSIEKKIRFNKAANIDKP